MRLHFLGGGDEDGSQPWEGRMSRAEIGKANVGRTSDVVFVFVSGGLPLSGKFLPFIPS